MENEDLHKNYIAPVIVGVLILVASLVYNFYQDNQKTTQFHNPVIFIIFFTGLLLSSKLVSSVR